MLEAVRVRYQQPAWRIAGDTCGLNDGERHLGHIVKTGNQWLAFDGTRPNDAGTGFRLLGTFPSSAAAKRIVEEASLRKKPSGRAFRGKQAG
jgi:hypothetical protein